MGDFPWILLSGLGLVWLGYALWSRREVEALRDAVDAQLLNESGAALTDATPLWFVPEPSGVDRLMVLDASQAKILKALNGISGEILSATAHFSTGDTLLLEDHEYDINGERQGSVLQLKGDDEIPALLTTDTLGPVNPSGVFGRVVGVLVLLAK